MVRLGDTLSVSRCFTTAEVEAFTALSEDRGPWHVTPDERGRLVVHGLLTIALSTRVGGALQFMARSFDIVFLKPVFTGDAITCTLTITELSAAPTTALGRKAGSAGTRLGADALISNQEGVTVATVRTRGVIPRPLEEVLQDNPRSRL